jgi:hypothetical protein
MVRLEYIPRGLGCEVRLIAPGLGEIVVTATGLEDQQPRVRANALLGDNVALTALVLTYTANELAYRRRRSPELRNSHLKAAAKAAKDAKAIADMCGRLESTSKPGWCSGCFENCHHRRVGGTRRPGAKYLCARCGTPTTMCAVPGCEHFATVKPSSVTTLCYCAEHHHRIPGFDKTTQRLSTLEDIDDWLSFEALNAGRITKVAGGTVAAAAVVAPMAFLAAPAVGAALGSSALGGSLTGAAATSHGLAMLGGGAVASGGLGVAGGTAVVTATGGALGGILGAGTVTAYAGSDKSFRIQKLRSGSGIPVVIASGFLTASDDGWGAWKPMVDARYPDSAVYRVHWGAKELSDIAVLVTAGSAKVAVRKVLTSMAKRGSKSFGSLPGLGWVLAANEVVANPWSVAKNRANMTGAVLADLIARTDEGPFVLVGHSLGARVMVIAAQVLGTRIGPPRIESMHLLGAAVGDNGDWRTLNSAVDRTVWNYFSTRDRVLRLLYSAAEFGERAVGERGFKSSFTKIKDRNVTSLVDSHSRYLSAGSLR